MSFCAVEKRNPSLSSSITCPWVVAAARRGGAEGRPEQTVWPHLIVGFVVLAVVAAHTGGAGDVVVAAGGAGALAGYLWHCWSRPFARCWWPTWWWLPASLKGCRNRPITAGKYYRRKKPCPLHPNGPDYRRVGARILGRGKDDGKDET